MVLLGAESIELLDKWSQVSPPETKKRFVQKEGESKSRALGWQTGAEGTAREASQSNAPEKRLKGLSFNSVTSLNQANEALDIVVNVVILPPQGL